MSHAPIVTSPAAHVTSPAPHVTSPAPHVTSRAPHVTSPAPHVTSPAPHVTSPAPHVTSPAPHVTSPVTRASALFRRETPFRRGARDLPGPSDTLHARRRARQTSEQDPDPPTRTTMQNERRPAVRGGASALWDAGEAGLYWYFTAQP